jgi:hypothetical protein
MICFNSISKNLFTRSQDLSSEFDTLASEAALIRRACGNWATPEALASAERAADRMRAQLAAMTAEIAKARRAA